MKLAGSIVVLLIIIAGGWYLMYGKAPSQDTAAAAENAVDSSMPVPSTDTSINPASKDVTITYTDQGFTPQSVTIPQGATVTFINQSSHGMWVASAPHPAHTGYDGTSRSTHCVAGYTGAAPFDECKNDATGVSWAFTFDKVGTWKYHNHSVDQDFGSITVTAPVEGGAAPSITN